VTGPGARAVAPRKSDDNYDTWLRARSDFIDSLQYRRDVIYAATDGSALQGSSKKTAAAFRAYRRSKLLARRTVGTGPVSAPDAEAYAIAMALGELTKPEHYDAKEIHIFSDCVPALQTAFDPSVRSAASARIISCQRIRPWFEARQDHVIHLYYVPGHKGILINELVDSDAQAQARSNEYQPDTISVSIARQTSEADALRAWTLDSRKPAIRGKQYLFSGRKPPKPTTKKGGGLFMRAFGSSNSLAARASRAITNHAPLGDYRRRFFPREPRDCVECNVEQTRAHVINTCTRYTRRRRNFLEFLKNSSDPGRECREFLVDNPSAFSFDDAPPTDN
jgi:ribonuclease HI